MFGLLFLLPEMKLFDVFKVRQRTTNSSPFFGADIKNLYDLVKIILAESHFYFRLLEPESRCYEIWEHEKYGLEDQIEMMYFLIS